MSKIDKLAFVQAVYDIINAIPYGRVTSYGAIAKAVVSSAFSPSGPNNQPFGTNRDPCT